MSASRTCPKPARYHPGGFWRCDLGHGINEGESWPEHGAEEVRADGRYRFERGRWRRLPPPERRPEEPELELDA